MEDWQQLLKDSLTEPAQLPAHLRRDHTPLETVIATFPMRINPYYLQLIERPGDPIWRQAIPDLPELHDPVCISDPLGEEDLSPVPNLVHKYPDRVLLLVTNQCAMYCRFCTRKRKVGTKKMAISPSDLNEAIRYLHQTPQVREILISGGDPLLLSDERLDELLTRLREIPTIEVIRMGTRVPCTLPMRITEKLAAILGKHHPLYINTHFNHPRELTPEAFHACGLLANAGIPLGCQTVLLKNVNNNAETLRQLFLGLLKMRVRPYYLFQGDLTLGTNHFRTPSNQGISIMRQLIGHISGMAIPTFVLDGPGGKGKIPLTPEYILKQGDDLVFKNYLGETCVYPESGDAI
ncbi:MAG: KamA family radical SAM protein [Desulfobulbaceae bacterium]|uniref:KamA family radical SAM protein n=1 Tax=Candidatus Desulfatifera sulfidica TaxID=2841691 RepID=A0A8J6NA09_9BACT|nr:KamA family radical SAM protein [Candidatus Desulfatifera sulfidica]